MPLTTPVTMGAHRLQGNGGGSYVNQGVPAHRKALIFHVVAAPVSRPGRGTDGTALTEGWHAGITRSRSTAPLDSGASAPIARLVHGHAGARGGRVAHLWKGDTQAVGQERPLGEQLDHAARV